MIYAFVLLYLAFIKSVWLGIFVLPLVLFCLGYYAYRFYIYIKKTLATSFKEITIAKEGFSYDGQFWGIENIYSIKIVYWDGKKYFINENPHQISFSVNGEKWSLNFNIEELYYIKMLEYLYEHQIPFREETVILGRTYLRNKMSYKDKV